MEGLEGALAAERMASVTSRSEDISDRRFSLRLSTCMVGLPACARDEYEPFQVDRLFLSSDGLDIVCIREAGRESGRGKSWSSEKEYFIGEGGAYISES